MENLVESFITELECHRRNISKEIEDVANTRINELNATLKRLEEVRQVSFQKVGTITSSKQGSVIEFLSRLIYVQPSKIKAV